MIDRDERSAPDIDGGRARRSVVNMSRKSAAADTSGPAGAGDESMSRSERLRWRAGQRAMTRGEERLARPVGREMEPEPTDTPADAAGDFEQVQTNRTDGRARQLGSCEDRASEMGEQQERDAMQLQPERVRAEAMAAKPVRVDVELELFDPILGRAAVVVPRDEIGGTAATVRDHEAEIESLGGDLDLGVAPWDRREAA